MVFYAPGSEQLGEQKENEAHLEDAKVLSVAELVNAGGQILEDSSLQNYEASIQIPYEERA